MRALTTTNWYLRIGLLLSSAGCIAQSNFYDTTFRSTYYEQKRALYEALPNGRKEIIFLGNSLTDTGEWAELLGNKRVKNRGISGDTSFGVLARLSEATASKPAKIFLMIGINDVSRGIPDSLILRNYGRIVRKIQIDSPHTRIYLQSILPTNDAFPQFNRHQQKEHHIRALNDSLQALALLTGQVFVDLRPYLGDATGKLSAQYTNDGLHLKGAGYGRWVTALREKKYVK